MLNPNENSNVSVAKNPLSHQQLLIQRNNIITSKINTQMIMDILKKDNEEGESTHHIRNITKGISLKYPDFNELSISKQRRVIMGILEKETNLFEKVGWGLWKLKTETDDDYAVLSSKEETSKLSTPSDGEAKISANSIASFHAVQKRTNSSDVVKIRRRSSAAGSNESIIITPNASESNTYKMPLFNSKDRTSSISNMASKSGVLLSTANLASINSSTKFIQLTKNKKPSYKFSNTKYNENALESSDDEQDNEMVSEDENGVGTDEEDWKSLGAEHLLTNSNTASHHIAITSSTKPHGGIVKTSHSSLNFHRKSSSSTIEENAAMLLIQLRRGSQ